MNSSICINDKRILGWKHYQEFCVEQVLEHPAQHSIRIIPSLMAAAIIVVIVAEVLSFIDSRLELRAMEMQKISTADHQIHFALIPVAHAATISAKKMIASAASQEVIADDAVQVTIGVKNTGSKTWKTSGSTQVVVIDGSAKKVKNAEVLATLQEETKPGRLAFFTVKFPAGTKTGVYKKRLALAAGGKKLSNISYIFEYVVKPKPVVAVPVAPKPQQVAANNPAPTPVPSNSNCVHTVSVDSSNCPPAAAAGPIIRVGVFNSADPQTVVGTSVLIVSNSANATLATVPAGTPVTLDYVEQSGQYQYSYNGNSFNSSSYLTVRSDDPSNVMTVTTFNNRPGWNQSINDNTFLGSLEIRYNSSKNRTWIINSLPIETYLKGTAEVSNDAPMEYLKAMAIAERTYATYHLKLGTKHADEFFTVDSALDQVYKGYGTQQRMSNLSAAVDATQGMVVTYNGQLAITPYFSWSDGHTRSMLAVWGVDKPWLQSVAEPAGYDKTTMFGHGVGLSGRGAYILAHDLNYTYDRILTYYYLGTSTAASYDNAL